MFSVVTELNYIQKGLRTDVESATISVPGGQLNVQESRLDYLNITALGKLRFNYFLLSPYIVLVPKIDFDISEADELIEDFNKNRLGLRVGFGTEVNILPTVLLVEFIYNADFNELYDENNLEINTDSFDLRLGIMF